MHSLINLHCKKATMSAELYAPKEDGLNDLRYTALEAEQSLEELDRSFPTWRFVEENERRKQRERNRRRKQMERLEEEMKKAHMEERRQRNELYRRHELANLMLHIDRHVLYFNKTPTARKHFQEVLTKAQVKGWHGSTKRLFNEAERETAPHRKRRRMTDPPKEESE